MATNKLDFDKVQESVERLLKELESSKSKIDKIFSAPQQIFLQIEFVKIPKVKKIVARIPLAHSLLTETSEVCFIPADVIRGRKVNHQLTIDRYTKLLQRRGVTDVQKIRIIPSRQIRVDYLQYEARRKLCNMFDVFLIDNKVSGYLLPKLGKTFDKARKWPIPIRVKRKNLKDEFISKLMKTSMALDSHGTVKTVQIGHVNMTAEQMTDNIVAVSNYIRKNFPAGWENIRSLHIKGLRSIAIPLYMSLISPNDVPVPVLKRKKKKSILAVDELSTVGKRVSVYRCGRVVVHDSGTDDDFSDIENDEAPDKEELDDLAAIGGKRSRKRQQESGKMMENDDALFEEKPKENEDLESDDSEDDDEEDKTKTENSYLYLRQMERMEDESEKEEPAEKETESQSIKKKKHVKIKSKKSKKMGNEETSAVTKSKKSTKFPKTQEHVKTQSKNAERPLKKSKKMNTEEPPRKKMKKSK